jgi:hypothetical protein
MTKIGLQVVIPFPASDSDEANTAAFTVMGKAAKSVLDVINDLTTQQRVVVLTSVLGALSEGFHDRGFVLVDELVHAVERRAHLDHMPEAQKIIDAVQNGEEVPEGVRVVSFSGGNETKH